MKLKHCSVNFVLEVCKSDPNLIRIRSDRIRSDFGTKILISDRIGLEKLFRSRIGSDFVIGRRSLFQLVILLCISCFIFNLTKHFHFHWLNWEIYFTERFFGSDRIGILYQNSDRIGFRSENFGSDRIRILNISQLSDCKRPIRSDAHL